MARLELSAVSQSEIFQPPALTVVSGVGGKLPAMFLLETESCRILLDIGEGPEPGVRPDISRLGRVDAICISHAHIDHVGSLSLWKKLGSPLVYATEWTWTQLDHMGIPLQARRCLPLNGRARVAGIDITTGRSGHSPGGIWMHFSVGAGILYMGDWTPESLIFPLDPAPRVGCVVTDASYGDRDSFLNEQVSTIAEAIRDGGVLPVPSAGRGPEMAVRLLQAGIRPILCPVVLSEVEYFANDRIGLVADGARELLRDVLRLRSRNSCISPRDVVIATEANAERGLAAELLARNATAHDGYKFIFTGHVPDNTPANDMLQKGVALWLPWNVHPRMSDNLNLISETAVRCAIPAFVSRMAVMQLELLSPIPLSWKHHIAL